MPERKHFLSRQRIPLGKPLHSGEPDRPNIDRWVNRISSECRFGRPCSVFRIQGTGLRGLTLISSSGAFNSSPTLPAGTPTVRVGGRRVPSAPGRRIKGSLERSRRIGEFVSEVGVRVGASHRTGQMSGGRGIEFKHPRFCETGSSTERQCALSDWLRDGAAYGRHSTQWHMLLIAATWSGSRKRSTRGRR